MTRWREKRREKDNTCEKFTVSEVEKILNNIYCLLLLI